jgi:hypothetical protein
MTRNLTVNAAEWRLIVTALMDARLHWSALTLTVGGQTAICAMLQRHADDATILLERLAEECSAAK